MTKECGCRQRARHGSAGVFLLFYQSNGIFERIGIGLLPVAGFGEYNDQIPAESCIPARTLKCARRIGGHFTAKPVRRYFREICFDAHTIERTAGAAVDDNSIAIGPAVAGLQENGERESCEEEDCFVGHDC